MALFDIFKKKDACVLLARADRPLVEKYRHFRDFLGFNRDALKLMAEIEERFYGGAGHSVVQLRAKVYELVETTLRLTETLNRISGGKYDELTEVCEAIGREIRSALTAPPPTPTGEMVLPLEAVPADGVCVAGGKATNLAVMGNVLGLPVPRGFVVTAAGLHHFLKESGLSLSIASILEGVDAEDPGALGAACHQIQAMVRRAGLPFSLAAAMAEAYSALEAATHPGVRIALRSSAVGEDSEASFAGQFVTVLNVDRSGLFDAYKSVVASKYSPRAILYRMRYGLEDEDTPMCVMGVEMIDSRASGVLYTVDPSNPSSREMRVSAVLGLGELLVSGGASPDDFFVDRESLAVVRREIRPKSYRVVPGAPSELRREAVSKSEAAAAAIGDEVVCELARCGKLLEEHFRRPQDVEWTVDGTGRLVFLQTRPLAVIGERRQAVDPTAEVPGTSILLRGGRAACPGAAAGTAFLADGKDLSAPPEDAILVARTASPDYAVLVGRVRGIITDVGSVASHLGSVAREFRVPALFDVGDATRTLRDGDPITLVSSTATVYAGRVEGLLEEHAGGGGRFPESPVSERLHRALERIVPLGLKDPDAPDFAPRGCRSLHDVVRFAHERILRELFSFAEKTEGAVSARLRTTIPLVLHCIDLGGGLEERLTTCDAITDRHLTSIPMRALWKGLTHPGITWEGTVHFDPKGWLTLLSSSAVAEFGPLPGGDSYAVLSRDYLNLSAKFAYHYANLDVYCAESDEDAGQNHILLQFSGGAGSFVGRSLRLQFLGAVLGRLGFTLNITGDWLEASFKGAGRKVMEETLDQLGRLLASSRLLDMTIATPEQLEAMTEAFFREDYDFLGQSQGKTLPGFYTPTGDWRLMGDREEGEGRGGLRVLQDGSGAVSAVGAVLARFMGKVLGARYQRFLDNMKAYAYFPLAVARESGVADASISVRVKPMSGRIGRAGGLVFGLRHVGDYFVLRVDALENDLVLFEFVNNRRFSRATVPRKIETGRWVEIRVETRGNRIRGFLDGELLVDYAAAGPVHGRVGLWTSADSVTCFEGFSVERNGIQESNQPLP